MKFQINAKELKLLAKSIGLEITDKDVEIILPDFNVVLDSMKIINSIDTTDIEAISQPFRGKLNKFSQDTPVKNEQFVSQLKELSQYNGTYFVLKNGKNHEDD